MKLAAGRWEATSVLTDLKAAGLPPEVASAMQAAIGEKDTSASCLTKEEVEKPGASFFAKGSDDCTYEHFKMGSGRLDAKMVCEAEGGKTTIKLGGTYSANSYDMAMESETAGGEQNGMLMKMTVKATHVGACRGDETSA